MRVFRILLLTLVLSPSAMAEVNFVTYVKRNMKVLKATETPQKAIAFEKKEMYRSLASDKPPRPVGSVVTPEPTSTASTPASPTSGTAAPGTSVPGTSVPGPAK